MIARDAGWHPLVEGCPPRWASAWGEDEYGVFVEIRVGEVDYRLRWIPRGSFKMGSPVDEPWRQDDEGPQHTVVISRGFWLGETPVTQALWEEVMGGNPSYFKRSPEQPVEKVSWEDCEGLCQRLGERVPGEPWRLPTEAEWEYACRGGTEEATYAAALGVGLEAIAWYGENSEGETHPVKEKRPNPWGLYDMLGNVWEWSSDGAYRNYSDRDDSSDVATDPRGPATGGGRVFRGGSWFFDAGDVRAAYRDAAHPGRRDLSLGLRLARDQDQ